MTVAYLIASAADIEVQMVPREMKRVRWLCDGGLSCFVRYNYDRDIRYAERGSMGSVRSCWMAIGARLFLSSFPSMVNDACAMLPEFRVIELWPDDVLLHNQNMRL